MPNQYEEEGVTIVIPAYNEENGISKVIDSVKETLVKHVPCHEILVVDDGSTDNTREKVRLKSVELVEHSINIGYGAALKTGIMRARYPVIGITDADGTYPVDVLPELIRRVSNKETDMAVGARTGDNVSIHWTRRPAKWVLSRLAELAAGRRIPDLNSGLRVFRKTAVLRMFNLLPSGFSFTTTITLAMLTNSYSVDYVPIDYFKRTGRSKIRPINDTANFMLLIFRIALYFAPLKVFLPISAILFLSGIFIGLYSILTTGKLTDVTTVLLVISSVHMLGIGLLGELINKRLPTNYGDD